MTNGNFVSWFKRDIWTHEEAACLFSGLTPDDETLRDIYLHVDNNITNKEQILEDYAILKCADWRSIGSLPSDCEERTPDEYIELASLKGMEVNGSLLDAHKRHLSNVKALTAKHNKKSMVGNSSGNGPPAISNKMLNTLKPVIDLIDDFKNCPDFKKAGTGLGIDIQQQLILDWLRTKTILGGTKKMTEREAVFLKDLITEHYGLTSGRK